MYSVRHDAAWKNLPDAMMPQGKNISGIIVPPPTHCHTYQLQ
jgi:hypothetical protein